MTTTRLIIASLLICLAAPLAAQDTHATAADAQAMLQLAITELHADEAAALAKFNDPGNTQFHDRDLYVFCSNSEDALFTAHPNPDLMGTDVRKLMVGDDPVGQRIYDLAEAGKINSLEYSYFRPGSTELVEKESFVTTVGSQDCGVGYYK